MGRHVQGAESILHLSFIHRKCSFHVFPFDCMIDGTECMHVFKWKVKTILSVPNFSDCSLCVE